MKVLYFLTGLGIGGIGKFVGDVVRNFDTSVELTTIALGNEENELAKELSQKGHLICFPKWSIEVLKRVKAELCSQKYDVVHVHAGFWSFIILQIAKKQKVPVRIAHSHSADSFSDLSGIPKLIYLSSRIANHFVVTHYFACSDHACIRTFGKKVLESQSYYRILNPVDDSFFTPLSNNLIRDEFNIPDDAIIACHVGYFGFHKNHDFILTLAERMRDEKVWWILVGNGNRFEHYLTITKAKKLSKVVLTGARSDIPEILNASDVFVFPSRLEGLGTVVMEAQACGVHCIISENVTCETDVGLGLVEQIKLEKIDKWMHSILKSKKQAVDPKQIKTLYEKKNITDSTCALYIYSLYNKFLNQRE